MSAKKIQNKPTVLVVDDEFQQRELLAGFLMKKGYNAVPVGSVTEAEEIFTERGFDAAILDLRLPDGNGIELLKKLRAIDPDLGAIMLTAYGDISTAAEGIRSGAFDFMEKPVDLMYLEKILAAIIDKRNILIENRILKETIETAIPSDIVAETNEMKEILSVVARVARTDAPVIITGESGTGKELISRLIHKASDRKGKPFVAINCAAIPDTLIESELFGYEPGAFTGAKKRQIGKLELASGGTVFLDEIGDLPLLLQAKILRFLEDGQFYRLGGTNPVRPDVRIISATNREIDAMVKNGEFRDDLFYRLNLISINIPPIRQRSRDLLHLAKKFLADFSRKHGKNISDFTTEARDKILRYGWRGNVRELKNVIERAIILSRKELIGPEFIPTEEGESTSLKGELDLRPLEDVEREHIIRILDYCEGNQSEAARILGLHRNTLRNKIKEYGLQ